jgi:hypothetical protein
VIRENLQFFLPPEASGNPGRRRPVEHIPAFLPTFKDIADPSMLTAMIQPSAIHSIDMVKKTAIVSYPRSAEKVTVSLHDVMILNPELLANWLVQRLP